MDVLVSLIFRNIPPSGPNIYFHRQLLGCGDERYTEAEMNGGEYGHITWQNQPESRKAAFTDVIDMGYAAESTTIGDVMDTLSGPFCYLYI